MKRKSENSADTSLQEALSRLKSAKEVVVDVETTGLDWRRNAIVGYVLAFSGDPRDSLYVPFRHQGTTNVGGRAGLVEPHGWDGKVYSEEAALIAALDQQTKTLIFHNGAFDLRFLWRVGMTKLQAKFQDTIINAPLLNEHAPKFSLEFCCEQAGVAAKKSARISEYLCSQFPEATAAPKSAMGHFWRLAGDDPVANEYATGDGTSTWQLRDWQMPRLAEQGLLRVHDIESRLIPVLARMTCFGIKIDVERLEFLRGHVGERIGQLLDQFPADFNVRSPNAVQKWCTDHGRTDWPLTPKGKPSFPEAWLKLHEPGQAIVRVRKLETLKSSFLDPMAETHLWNGRVHTEFNQLRGDEYGTVTGRLSSSNPNLQQITKHDRETGLLHRSIFVPDIGKVWASVDFSQIEPRLLAYYSRAKVLLEGYNADPPVDAHTSVSAAMNPNWSTMTKDERKHYRDAVGKRINQTLITGGGKKVLVEKYGVDPKDADAQFAAYFRAIPELRPLQKRAAKRMRERGYVLSLLDRRARLADPRKDYTAVNRLLQVGNADVIKTKLVEIDDYLASEGRPLEVLNNIHDDIAFQFVEEARPVYDQCRAIMTNFGPGQLIELDVPITADAGEGPNWAVATYGDDQ